MFGLIDQSPGNTSWKNSYFRARDRVMLVDVQEEIASCREPVVVGFQSQLRKFCATISMCANE